MTRVTKPMRPEMDRARRPNPIVLIGTVVILVLSVLLFMSPFRSRALYWFGGWKTTINTPVSVFGHWQPKVYDHGLWRYDRAALEISTNNGPGGIYFHAKLDQNQRHLLTVRGETREGTVNMRVRAAEQDSKWFSAPAGAAIYLVPLSEEIEVLIYADEPFDYLLRDLSVTTADFKVADEVVSSNEWTQLSHSDESLSSVASLFPGWYLTPYAHPTVKRTTEGMLLKKGRDRPSGVFFRRAINLSSTYQVKLQGRRIEGSPVMRIQIDDNPPVWYPIDTDGRAGLMLNHGSQVEVLVYADDPYSFELTDLTLSECATCLTDNQLKRRISEEAGLRATDPNVLVARKLTKWVANIGVIGPEPQLMNKVTEAIVLKSPSETFSQYFLPKRGGVSCGGMAAFLTKIFLLFGLESFWIDIGYLNSSLTHVTTVLVDDEDSTKRFYIFDPTFNGTYMDGAEYVQVDRLLQPGAKGRFVRDRISRVVLVPKVERRRFLRDSETAHTGAVCDRDSLVPYTLECSNFDQNLEYNLIMMGRTMEEHGFPKERDFIVGLLKQRLIEIGPVVNTATRSAFLHMLATYNVPTALN